MSTIAQAKRDEQERRRNEGAWVITWGNPELDLQDDVGTSGPSHSTIKKTEIINNPLSYEFDMWEDGEVTPDYSGWCYLPEGFTEAAFRPLNDFGEANTGCASIRYRNKETGEYETL